MKKRTYCQTLVEKKESTQPRLGSGKCGSGRYNIKKLSEIVIWVAFLNHLMSA